MADARRGVFDPFHSSSSIVPDWLTTLVKAAVPPMRHIESPADWCHEQLESEFSLLTPPPSATRSCVPHYFDAHRRHGHPVHAYPVPNAAHRGQFVPRGGFLFSVLRTNGSAPPHPPTHVPRPRLGISLRLEGGGGLLLFFRFDFLRTCAARAACGTRRRGRSRSRPSGPCACALCSCSCSCKLQVAGPWFL
jgi:hypothetical protein